MTEFGGLCKKCEIKKTANKSGKKSGDVQKWMNSARYRNLRKNWIKGKFCVKCIEDGRPLARATVLDHIVPHKGDYGLFWDKGNWQPLCATCHNRKTATEDGGFGNRRKL